MCHPSFTKIVVSLVSALLITAALESPISTFIVGLEASILKRQEVSILQKIIHRESYQLCIQYDKTTKTRGLRLHSPNPPKHIGKRQHMYAHEAY